MKRTLLLLVLVTAVAAAQQAAPPPVQSTNLVEKETAPSYSDVYCAGFVTNEPINHANMVAGGAEAPTGTLYGMNDTLFLSGGGYQVNQQLTVVRELQDPNRFEPFAGQRALLNEIGQPYAELGRLRVVKTSGDLAIAQVELSCEAIAAGDFVIPFQERPTISLRKQTAAFDRFPDAIAPAGRIVLAKDFDLFVGTGSKVYISAGAQKGVRVGDYLRITRGYGPEDVDPAAVLSYSAPQGMDTQKHPVKVTKQDARRLPRQAIGELVILNVTPTSATGMITFALDAVKVGDLVEPETAPQQ